MAALPENTQMSPINDSDPQETREWQEALTGVIDKEGADRAHFLIEQMIAQAREDFWIALSGKDGLDDGPGAYPVDVAEDIVQLQVHFV